MKNRLGIPDNGGDASMEIDDFERDGGASLRDAKGYNGNGSGRGRTERRTEGGSERGAAGSTSTNRDAELRHFTGANAGAP